METGFLNHPQPPEWRATFRTATGLEARLEAVHASTIALYAETGIQAYREHYPHLWQGHDPAPYLEHHFNPIQVLRDLGNASLRHALLRCGGETAGILKLDFGRDSGEFYPREALFIEKIYLKKAFTGQGLGGALLGNLCDFARHSGLRALWLETMYKGPARTFYLQQGFRFLDDAEVPYPEIVPEERAMWVMGREA
jgi:GNAT superfamily N-acetyltransferase